MNIKELAEANKLLTKLTTFKVNLRHILKDGQVYFISSESSYLRTYAVSANIDKYSSSNCLYEDVIKAIREHIARLILQLAALGVKVDED